MYELNRALLQSIGPKGARYETVVLDFRDEHDDPARGSVLFLENGGGKSVLLKLAFSVVLAGRKLVVGASANTKTLENFVLSGDTGHVVLEWRRVDADGTALPELLLTGKAYEWRARQHSSDSQNLREAWYTLRPSPDSLTLDTLPTRLDGRKRTFASFKEQLEAAHRGHPELDLTWTDVHRKWHAHLDALGLDPELFKYQREMNADEGDADELFAFRSHEAFVDFLLKAITDREGPAELATNVDLYMEKLRDRERLQLEQAFVDGSLTRLRPLAEAAARREDAAQALRDAQRTGESVHGQFAAAAADEQARHQQLAARAEHEERRRAGLDTRGRELQEQLRELRRRAAQFRLDAAEALLADANAERTEAHTALDAWRATEDVLRHRALAAEVKRLTDALADAQRDAAPVLERRRAAADRYAGSLMALIDAAREHAGTAEQTAARDTEQTREKDAASGTQRERAGALRAEADAAQRQLDAIEKERDKLITAGLLARGQTPDDALEALDGGEADAERRATEASERIAGIDVRRRELTDAIAAAKLEAQRATDAADQVDTEREALQQRAEQLTANARLREVADVEHIDVWRMADPLRQRLADAVAAAERGLVMLELEAADDKHALRALDETGRLPATRDAVQAVEALRKARIAVVSGWEYLAENVRRDRREALLRELPELIGGVVLANAAHRERAEAVLADAALQPTSIVAVGDAGELDAAVAAPRSAGRFIVDPNAALYDEDAGDAERELRAERVAQMTDRRRDLTARYRDDQQLRHDFDRFLADCPRGRLRELVATAAEHRERAAAAKSLHEEATREMASLDAERPACVEALRAANRALRDIENARPRLEALRDRTAAEPQLRDTVRERTQAAADAEHAAEQLRGEAEHLRAATAEANRLADHERGRADRLGEELARIEGAGDDVERVAAPEPLEALRGDYELVTRMLVDATTGSVLASEHQRAEQNEAAARARLEEHSSEVRSRAGALLVEATDRTARREGERRAHGRATLADDLRAERRAHRDACRTELERATPRDESGRGPRAQLTGELVPRDLDHALALTNRLDAERDRALQDQRVAADAARQAAGQAAKAESRAEVLSMSAQSVLNALNAARAEFEPDEAPAATPFPGTTDEAKALLSSISGALREAVDDLDQAEDLVRDQAERLARYAAAEEFAPMAGNLRDRLTRSEPAQLAGDAGALIPHLEARASEVAKELASIDKHRTVLVERLTALVQTALTSLRQAGRASRLPADLGDWSGKQFLRIDFAAPDNEDVLIERLGEVLDAAAHESADRDGMTMLLRGVRAAAHPAGFRVTVLKPDTVLRDDRVDVTAMGEFSGGQRLTAAIALYCTLAAMRSESRGRRQRRAGVLFLDNPIGTASAEYLLDIQLKVAERVGVQLVYTTGVFDTNALSKFPCVLRLRNDLDMRAGMQHIRVAEPLRRALVNGRAPDDDAGYVDVARVVHQRDEVNPA
jgi:hypothetical protein